MAPKSILVATFTGRSAREVPPADALLEDGADQGEVRRDLLARGAAEELLALAQLDLHDLGELGILLEHPEVQLDEPAHLGHRVGLVGDGLAARDATNSAIFSRKSVMRMSSLVLK